MYIFPPFIFEQISMGSLYIISFQQLDHDDRAISYDNDQKVIQISLIMNLKEIFKYCFAISSHFIFKKAQRHRGLILLCESII